MELNTGREIDVVGQININNSPHMICELPHVVYVNETLVKFIVLPPHEFKEYVQKMREESNQFVVN